MKQSIHWDSHFQSFNSTTIGHGCTLALSTHCWAHGFGCLCIWSSIIRKGGWHIHRPTTEDQQKQDKTPKGLFTCNSISVRLCFGVFLGLGNQPNPWPMQTCLRDPSHILLFLLLRLFDSSRAILLIFQSVRRENQFHKWAGLFSLSHISTLCSQKHRVSRSFVRRDLR